MGHYNQLRAHHPCADADWEYIPAYHCQHQRPECEPPLSFPNCSHEQRRHSHGQRKDLYHALVPSDDRKSAMVRNNGRPFVRTAIETLSLVAMSVCNPDRAPVGINR